MAFRLGRGGKRSSQTPLYNEDQVVWGVPRRAGLDEQDDPKAHAGLTQHAFEPGNDEKAICGFEPPKRASGPTAKPRAQLAVPNPRLNPRCPKCLKLIAVPAPAAADVTEEAAPDDEPAAVDGIEAGNEPKLADEPERNHEAEVTEEVDVFDTAPEAPAPLAAIRIGEAEIERERTANEAAPGAEQMMAADELPEIDETPDAPDASVMAIVGAAELPHPPDLPLPADPEPGPPQPNLMPPPPPPAPRSTVDPPMSMRSASWEGTVVYATGQMTALVRPPSQSGMGVVASVISGPSGTRVGSVRVNADGLAEISLSEPARGPVSVAWFAVPAVDESLRPGGPNKLG
jgi:hypothetical protein